MDCRRGNSVDDRVQDQATLQAQRLVSLAEHPRLTTTDHRLLKQLASQSCPLLPVWRPRE